MSTCPTCASPVTVDSYGVRHSTAKHAERRIAELEAENARLRKLTTEPEHGNEYSIVCHYKDIAAAAEAEGDALAAKLAALEKEIAEAPVVYSDRHTERPLHTWRRARDFRKATHRARLVRIERIVDRPAEPAKS